MIPIYKPYLSKFKQSALDAIESEWISRTGSYIPLANEKLKELIGAPYCVLTNTGAAATHCLFVALKFKHPELKKIYVPNHVFVCAYNCGVHEYGKEMFEVMKTDPVTMQIDTSADYILGLEKNAAVVIVHNLGGIVNLPRLKKLRPDLVFVEDNCEGMFGKYEGMSTGSFPGSLASAVSFHSAKTITSGEGGAFFTHDEEVYKHVLCYHSHGMSEKAYVHNLPGMNYRMTNIQAALLYDQLLGIDEILGMKATLYRNYVELLGGLEREGKVVLFKDEEATENAMWMFCCNVPGQSFWDVSKYMKGRGVEVRPIFYDIRVHKHLSDIAMHDDGWLDMSCGMMLPSFPEITRKEQEYIVECLADCLAHLEAGGQEAGVKAVAEASVVEPVSA